MRARCRRPWRAGVVRTGAPRVAVRPRRFGFFGERGQPGDHVPPGVQSVRRTGRPGRPGSSRAPGRNWCRRSPGSASSARASNTCRSRSCRRLRKDAHDRGVLAEAAPGDVVGQQVAFESKQRVIVALHRPSRIRRYLSANARSPKWSSSSRRPRACSQLQRHDGRAPASAAEYAPVGGSSSTATVSASREKFQ